MKIYDPYTDTGNTILADGTKLAKEHVLVEAMGTIDETNSFLGIIYAQHIDDDLKEIIDKVQRNLCRINSVLGNAPVSFEQDQVKSIEKMIQKIEADLPPLTNFILSGSGFISAQIQFTRSLVRTAERRVALLKFENDYILPFLNRLSDLLFQMARIVDKREERPERQWEGK